jgi:hypothetical protein
MGDAVNWEWIVRCAKLTKSNIAIVSRDSDYGVKHENTMTLNDHPRSEFASRVNKEQHISLYTKLTEALKQLHVTVSPKEVMEENRLIQSSEAAGLTDSNISDFLSARFNAFYNSASTRLSLKTLNEMLAASEHLRAGTIKQTGNLRSEGDD